MGEHREWGGKAGTLYQLVEGDCAWAVQHNDNSDHGRVMKFFDSEQFAWDYVDEITEHPPLGNDRHPAPKSLNVRVFFVERLGKRS